MSKSSWKIYFSNCFLYYSLSKLADGQTSALSYQYDGLDQLIRVNDQEAGTTTLYTYDAGGNITSAKTYPYSPGELSGSPLSEKSYSYASSGWKDLLINFSGDDILYDEIGNPLQYRDGMAFAWQYGRRLASVSQGSNAYAYSYDASGVRLAKTINGSSYNYIYDNGVLLYADTPLGGMTFIYDNDSVIGYKYNSSYYFYLKNLQGDILGAVDASGNLLYQYRYDAWGVPAVLDAQGNPISPDSAHIANANPLRYRGYFFDSETGFYYLLSRYYDPETGRFINADKYISTGQGFLSFNMYNYCLNNPVKRTDSLGGASCTCNPWRPLKGCPNHGFFKNTKSFSDYNYALLGVVKGVTGYKNTDISGTSPKIGSVQSPYLNSDGSYSLYDNRRHNPNSVFHEQAFSVDASGPSWDIANGSIGIGSITGSVITGGWEWEHANLSILDFGTVQAAAEINRNGAKIGAMASLYTPSFSFDVCGITISLDGHIGSVGAYADAGPTGFSLGGALGCGFGLSIEW